MKPHLTLLGRAIAAHWRLWTTVSVGFLVLYYTGLLLVTMLRFQEVPNYVVFHDVLQVYGLILAGTPSWWDAVNIMVDEPWLETGYKNPDYYGVATWSYMLIPPKMLIVLLCGMLLATLAVLLKYSRGRACANAASNRSVYAVAGLGSAMVGLTSATLTWVVCCATPSWVVALAMLGMSASLALWLEPLGKLLTLLGIGLMAVIIVYRLRQLSRPDDTRSPATRVGNVLTAGGS